MSSLFSLGWPYITTTVFSSKAQLRSKTESAPKAKKIVNYMPTALLRRPRISEPSRRSLRKTCSSISRLQRRAYTPKHKHG